MIAPGDRIGHIRVEEPLAEGGMGAVYLGFDEKLERRVALKAIRRGRQDADARVRFLAEARLLSRLDHPNIYRIHEYLEDRRGDFLVLELIRGRTLREALAGGLSFPARLAAAEGIARALEAAHEKGIVHRDLKLDNVMVTEEGGVKVLDFGLARDLDAGAAAAGGADASDADEDLLPAAAAAGASLWLPAEAGRTRQGLLVGTPAGMSPEQARGEPASAASDAYALGLLLQELFASRPPYEPGLPPALLLARAAEGETLPVTGVRDADLAALIRRLKAKAPAARPTAAEAAARLASIRGKPRRRRLRLLAAALAAAFALGGVKYTLDLERERRAALAARHEARLEAAQAAAAARFLEELFKASDPRLARGRMPDARELLARGTERLDRELRGQPLLRARLLHTLGGTYTSLGLYAEARPLLKEALAIRRRLLGPDHLEVAETLGRLGILAQASGLGDAVILFRRELAIREHRQGPLHPEVARGLNDLGMAMAARGRIDEGEAVLERALALDRQLWGERDPRVAKVLHNLAGIAHYRGRPDDAARLLERALAIREASLPEDDPDLAGSREALAIVLRQQGRPAEAVRLLERLADTVRRVYGPDHPELGRILMNLGTALSVAGDDAKARRALERSVAIGERTFGPSDPVLLARLASLAEHHRQEGRPGEAAPLARRVLAATDRRQAARPENFPHLAVRVRALLDLGRRAEARPLIAVLRRHGFPDAALETLCRRHGL